MKKSLLPAALALLLALPGHAQRCRVSKTTDKATGTVGYFTQSSTLGFPDPVFFIKKVSASDTTYQASVYLQVQALPADLKGVTFLLEDGGQIESPAALTVVQSMGQMILGGNVQLQKENFLRLTQQKLTGIKLSAFIIPLLANRPEKIRRGAECIANYW